MSRPPKCRWVGSFPDQIIFKPLGYPIRCHGIVQLTLDELETLRQAHLLGKTQSQGAEALGVSRSTFGRILESAHRRLADALINHKTICINGGQIIMDKRKFQCRDCNHVWEEPFGTGRPGQCPACGSANFTRSDSGPRGLGNCKGGPHGGRGGRGGGGRGKNAPPDDSPNLN